MQTDRGGDRRFGVEDDMVGVAMRAGMGASMLSMVSAGLSMVSVGLSVVRSSCTSILARYVHEGRHVGRQGCRHEARREVRHGGGRHE